MGSEGRARSDSSGDWQHSLLQDMQSRGPSRPGQSPRAEQQPLTPGRPHLDRLQWAQRAVNTSLHILSEQENHLTTSLPTEPAPALEPLSARGHGPGTVSARSAHRQPCGTEWVWAVHGPTTAFLLS